jgi:membrane protease YdiL (CAAX protease family)
MKTYTKRQIATYIILLLLLIIRISNGEILLNFAYLLHISFPPTWAASLVAVHDCAYYLWTYWSFVAVGIVIVVNRDNLKDVNVDVYFLVIFICCGLAYSRYYFLPSGWLAVVISVAMAILYIRRIHNLEKPNPNMGWIFLILTIIFILSLLLARTTFTNANLHMAIHTFVIETPLIALEEVVFRGLLWNFLDSLNWSAPKTIISQAILFWLSHAYFMFISPIFFWFVVPITGIILGILVWRFKSITPSMVVHIFINLYFTVA